MNNEIVLLKSQIFDDGAKLAKIRKEIEEVQNKKKNQRQFNQNIIHGKYPKQYSNQLFNITSRIQMKKI